MNQNISETPKVTISRGDGVDKDRHKVEPPEVAVKVGHKVEFLSADSDARISFPDSGIIELEGSWETIYKGQSIKRVVNSSGDPGTYYYAVMCKHDDGEYWYAEGNSCPAMIVER
jgi:plastocyanin